MDGIGEYKVRSKEKIKDEIKSRRQRRHEAMATRNHETTMQRLEAVLKLGEGSPLDEILKEVDKTLSVHLFELRRDVMEQLTILEEKVQKIEDHAKALCKWHHENQVKVVKDARHMIDLERTEKAVLCRWLNGFIVNSKEEPVMDPIDFSFSRFALNIAAASYTTTDPSRMIDAGVPQFLCGMLRLPNDIVRGPAALALAHLALHDRCKDLIGTANGIPPMIEMAVESQSPAVIAQGCTALAALALWPANKPVLAQRAGLAALIDLVEEGNADPGLLPDGRPRVTPEVQRCALQALANALHGSDANRTLCIELGVMEPLVHCLQKASDDRVLVQAAKALGNCAYGNAHTATQLLHAGADQALAAAIETCDLRADGSGPGAQLVESGLLALANLSNHEMNQSQLGGSACLPLVVRVLRCGAGPRALRAAGMAVGGLAYKSLLNKTRLGDRGAVTALLETAERMDQGIRPNSTPEDNERRGRAGMACLYALSQVLTHPPNQIIFRDAKGYERLIDLCEATEHMGLLEAGAMALSSLVPECDEKVRLDKEGRSILVEELGGQEALLRCRQWVFGRAADGPPEWLGHALDTLRSPPEELEKRMRGEFYHRPEPFTRHFLFEEQYTLTEMDLEIATSRDIQELVYKIY